MNKLPLLNFILLVAIIAYLLIASTKKQAYHYDQVIPEITAERLTIVGSDGNKYIVLSNPEKQALATIDGKPVNPEDTERNVAGLLFFNEAGDEIGGLVYGIDSAESYQLLTFDQRKNDQIMALRKDEYLEEGEWKRRYGLLLQERSEKPLDVLVSELHKIGSIEDTAVRAKEFEEFYSDPENQAPTRMFIGRTYMGEVGLFLMDKQNRPRLQIYLDDDGEAHIERFDKQGNKTTIK